METVTKLVENLKRFWLLTLILVLITGAAGFVSYREQTLPPPLYTATSEVAVIADAGDSTAITVLRDQRVQILLELGTVEATVNTLAADLGVNPQEKSLSLLVEERPGTGIVSVTATSSDPDTAVKASQYVSNMLVEANIQVQQFIPTKNQQSIQVVPISSAEQASSISPDAGTLASKFSAPTRALIGLMVGLALSLAITAFLAARKPIMNWKLDSTKFDSLPPIAVVKNKRANGATATISGLESSNFDSSSNDIQSLRLKLKSQIEHNKSSSLQLIPSLDSVTTSELAIALSEAAFAAGMKTALVDGDLAKKVLTNRLGRQGTCGLSDFLSGRCDYKSLHDQDVETSFHFFSAGTQPAHSEINFESKKWKTLLNKFESEFDFVVILSSRIDQDSHSLALAQTIPTVLLHIENSKTSTKIIEENIRDLGLVEVKASGAIWSAS